MTTIQRGKITRADIANWDGTTKTYSRSDATGGTVTELTVGDFVDVLQVFGSGDTRTSATVNSALTGIGSNVCTLNFATGNWTIDADVTVPVTAAVYVPAGCVFNVATGITLTFNGPVHVQYAKNDGTGWYSLTGTGDLVCNLGATGYPGW